MSHERVLDEAPFQHGPKDGSMAVDASVLERSRVEAILSLGQSGLSSEPHGVGAIMGYVGLRRVEVANLITISEGIRSDMAAENNPWTFDPTN